MALYISSLNSGSNGNCYYIGNDDDAVLIDAGLSCRETERRMKRVGLSMDKVRAIFISHEHGDHIRGLQVMAKRYYLPVYISAPTLSYTRMPPEMALVRDYKVDDTVRIGNMTITAFLKRHDAADPYSFVVEQNDVRVGVFTDIGSVCESLTYHFSRCHAAFLEANYDVQMLENGRYPYHLKRRITGGHGHLSNVEALELFRNSRPDYMSHLLLAHLSQDNNAPELVQQLFESEARGVHISVASRYEPTPVYKISGNATQLVTKAPAMAEQMSLF